MSGPPTDGYYPQQAHHAGGWAEHATTSEEVHARRRRRARVPLVVAGALLALAVLAAGGVAVGTWWVSRDLGPVTSSTTAHSRQLVAGHCVADLPADGPLGQVRLVPCEDPHDAEVVAVHSYGSDRWPGAEQVRREATAACEMDNAQRAAGAVPVVWTPTQESWDDGDREALCLAFHPDGPVTGSWATGDVSTH